MTSQVEKRWLKMATVCDTVPESFQLNQQNYGSKPFRTYLNSLEPGVDTSYEYRSPLLALMQPLGGNWWVSHGLPTRPFFFDATRGSCEILKT